jgi:hypothetical protein
MAKKIINVQFHEGGISTDPKRGIANSAAYMKGLDFRKQPSQLSVLPQTRKLSGGNVIDLVLDMCQVPSGTRYMIGNTGKFYSVDTSNVVSTVADLGSASSGLLYRADSDGIYITNNKTVSYYDRIASSPSIKVNKFAQSRSTATTAYTTGGTLTYTTPLTVSESSQNYKSFQSDIEPLYSIKVKVVDKGTGDWTLTLHDDANNSLATSTITSANLTNNSLNEFVFSSQVRILVKPNARTYHFHLTSTVADGTAQCSSAGDLSTADYEIWADRLVSTQSGLHPVVQFTHLTCIGNERYLSTHEPLSDTPSNLEWQRHRLTFPPGYEATTMATTDEFVAVGCGKRSTTGTRDFQEGKIFAWDGASTTYNFFVDVPMGAPQSLFTFNNLVYFVASGSLYVWPGGKRIYKIRTLSDTDSTYTGVADQTYNYPNMATVRRGIMLLGFPSYTTNTNTEHAVYSWGALDKNYPDAFGNNYSISTSTRYNTSGNLKLGMVKNFGDTMYLSWQDDASTYGVDVVDNSSTPATVFTWESLVVDGGVSYKQKLANRIRITTEALPADTLIYPKIKVNRGAWLVSTQPMAVGDTSIVYNVPNGSMRFYEAQFGFDGTYSGTAQTPPKIISVAFEFDSLDTEKDV